MNVLKMEPITVEVQSDGEFWRATVKFPLRAESGMSGMFAATGRSRYLDKAIAYALEDLAKQLKE